MTRLNGSPCILVRATSAALQSSQSSEAHANSATHSPRSIGSLDIGKVGRGARRAGRRGWRWGDSHSLGNRGAVHCGRGDLDRLVRNHVGADGLAGAVDDTVPDVFLMAFTRRKAGDIATNRGSTKQGLARRRALIGTQD